MSNRMTTTVLAAVVAFAPMAVSAATVSFSALPATVSDNPDPTASLLTSLHVTDSVSGVRLSPYEGTSFAGTAYTSVSAGGFAEYALGGVKKMISFVWGSPDSYNSVEFLLGGILQDTLTVSNAGANLANPFATVSNIDGGMGFDSIVFRSSQNAFEYGNLTAAVPLPAGGLLLAGAFGGLGAIRRRRKSA